jgi:uncharacterized protein (DUF927 family)
MSDHLAADAFRPLVDVMPSMEVPAPDGEEHWEVLTPPAGRPTIKHRELGRPSAHWAYKDAQGQLLFYVARFDHAEGGKKSILPFSFGRRVWTDKDGQRQDRTGWHWKAPRAPCPIYGLDRLAAQPNAVVLVVEGEKTAESAARRFPEYVAVTSQGGSKAARKADWSQLKGRQVVIWPDRDEAGKRYATEVARALRSAGAASVHIVQVLQDWPEGWDLADELPSGVTEETLTEMLNEAADSEPPVLPRGFSFGEAGLFHQPEADDADPVFIAAPFEIVGEANDGAGMDWGLVIRWRDRDGRKHQWSIPKRLVHAEGNRIAEELENAGLHCHPSPRARSLLKQFIGDVCSKRRLTSVDRTGWHLAQGQHAFVLPGGEVYGPAAGKVIMQTDRGGAEATFASAGTLADWQEQLGRFAVGNDRLALSICTALSTPLLDIVGGDSGGIHLTGESQTGKSTVLYVAGSVWGKGTRGAQVRQWRTTANGLESIAAETSDTALILDEMGQASAVEVADTIYMLANGSGKLRASRDGGARKTRTWRTTILSTGEIPLAAKMAEANRKMMAGLEVRLVNLPADAGVILGGTRLGVFQTLHGMPSAGELAKHLQQAARTHYGTAGRAFLSALVRARVRAPDELNARIRAAQAEFLKRHVPGDAAGQVRSVSDRFALIGVAGELAREFGVLPWPEGEAMRAALACFKAWLAERGGVGASEDDQAVTQVLHFIEVHGEASFTVYGNDYDPIDTRTVKRAGFRRRVGERNAERWEYLILSTVWKSEVCKGLDPKRVARVLRDRGLLIPVEEGSRVRNSGTQHIPGHGRAHVYRISPDILAYGGDPEASVG